MSESAVGGTSVCVCGGGTVRSAPSSFKLPLLVVPCTLLASKAGRDAKGSQPPARGIAGPQRDLRHKKDLFISFFPVPLAR